MSTTYGILHLHRIECHETEEGGVFTQYVDEIKLYKDGSPIYGQVDMRKGGHYAINQQHRFESSVSIKVEEQDSPDPNDDFGTHTFTQQHAGGEREAWYGGGGGRYRLVYSVTVHYNPERFFPNISILLKKATLDLGYYTTLPERVMTNIHAQLLGVSSSIQEEYILRENGEVSIEKLLGSKNFDFRDLEGSHSCSVDFELTERYRHYIPDGKLKYHFAPSIAYRSEDQGKNFVEVLPEQGAEQVNQYEIVIATRFPWTLHFQATLRFPRSLVVHQAATVNHFTSAVHHYFEQISQSSFQQNQESTFDLDVVQAEIPPNLSGRNQIIVTQEGAKGRNQTFKDQFTGATMSREEFVNAIKANLYPGFHIRFIDGVETPVSDPDTKLENNLG